MSGDITLLVEGLQAAVEIELRAMITYGHMAAFCRGVDRLLLNPLFSGEAAESVLHLGQVRDMLADLGAEAHTHYEFKLDCEATGALTAQQMLKLALTMELEALSLYTSLHGTAEELGLVTLTRKLEALLDQEQESVHEMTRLLR